MTHIVEFVLQATGQDRQHYEEALNQGWALPPNTEASRWSKTIMTKTTPFLTYINEWERQATVAPKARDEYRSAIEEFAEDVEQSLESLRESHVQHWVADLECGHTRHVRDDPP